MVPQGIIQIISSELQVLNVETNGGTRVPLFAKHKMAYDHGELNPPYGP